MKIPLNTNGGGGLSDRASADRVLEQDILAAKGGDWNAKANLARAFLPLITSLAEKRAQEIGKINAYIEAGKEGVYAAAKKYKSSMGAHKFRLFALDFIEKHMDGLEKGGGGLLSRIFGG